MFSHDLFYRWMPVAKSLVGLTFQTILTIHLKSNGVGDGFIINY